MTTIVNELNSLHLLLFGMLPLPVAVANWIMVFFQDPRIPITSAVINLYFPTVT